MSKYNLRRSPQFKHILLSSCQIRKNNIDGNREANLGQRRLRRKGCLGEGRCGERGREREEVRNERMKVMKGKSGDRQKTVRLSLQRGLGPGLSVSAETSTLQMTGYTHKHTLAQLRQSSTETLASLLLQSLKPRGIEEKTQLCVFF